MTGKLLTIYSMAVLGKFADGIFSESQGISFPYLWQILGCILAAVLIPAVLSTGNDVVMTNASLKHGKCILKRYLNKTYEGARKLNASEVQYRLEDDQIELCIFPLCLVIFCTSRSVLAVGLPFLFWPWLFFACLFR